MMHKRDHFSPWVYYLVQPYTADPKECVFEAMQIVKEMADRGYTVFSPILHTHFFHEYFNHPDIDYIDWDIQLMHRLKPILLLSPRCDYIPSEGVKREIEVAKKHKYTIVKFLDFMGKTEGEDK